MISSHYLRTIMDLVTRDWLASGLLIGRNDLLASQVVICSKLGKALESDANLRRKAQICLVLEGRGVESFYGKAVFLLEGNCSILIF